MTRMISAALYYTAICLTACQSQTLTSQTDNRMMHVANMPAEAGEAKTLSYKDYPFGKEYKQLWSKADVMGEWWYDSGGGWVGFKLHDGETINDLLAHVAIQQFPTLTVGFTDQTDFGGHPLMADTAVSGDFAIYISKSYSSLDDVDPLPFVWAFTLCIPADQVSVEKLKIPPGLQIEYENNLQAMVDFHNGRQVEPDDKKPTTWQMYRSGLNRGTFGAPSEEN